MRRPKIATMLALGFSSGLPFMLVGNTFGFWLRDEGIGLTTIGFLSWVGLAYSLKVFWSPIIDRTDVPLLGRLGRRRGWMLLTQLTVAIGLLGMAVTGPKGGLTAVAVMSLITAFAAASQDVVIDAWRIEIADNDGEIGLLTSASALGYRIALLITDALIISLAGHLGWPISYTLMAILMVVGIGATLFAAEPERADTVLEAKAPLWTARGFGDAIVGPFIAFFSKYKALAALILAAVAFYRLPDFIMGPMYNPYYHDLGISKDMVGGMRSTVGLIAAVVGTAFGGVSSVRFGVMPSLIAGAVLQGLGTAAFALLAIDHGPLTFGAVMAFDNLAQGYAGVVLIAYMSSLTSLGYTATQYALLSSTYALPGKFFKGFSGAAVEGLQPTHGLIGAYSFAFIGAGLIALPSLVLFLLLKRLSPATSDPPRHGEGDGA
ncbi:PAT family beta-lactamase induction signal transducer AmpG [Sphingomonas vulcanisoli]|uniref:PAT family beta-lactamase induction signal transducer AmpG n=1 Tax=Sphingomonas vulcanisoli TaxID=1658060 RepID=A0ABX0TND8_9SPHN|nr:MFS transporter [Sphingomonas vulcanisoli]NIJ06951.1 PAT family beta-lactamase induction signal transducer AmpG [Sphingomonas vulcanisoli]